jgi:hypothetical protein
MNCKGEPVADFGQGGTRTVSTFNVTATVNGSAGEHLAYKVTVQGGMPDFVFTCQHQNQVPITSADKFQGHPKQVYAWKLWKTLPANPGATDFATDTIPLDTFTVAMSFLGAVAYTLQIELRDGNDQAIRTIQNINYKSQVPNDTAMEGLTVTFN